MNINVSGFIVRIIKSVTLESVVRFTARRTADLVFYSIPLVKDPKITATIYVTQRVVKVAAVKYKRINKDSRQIFEDAIDAVTEAY